MQLKNIDSIIFDLDGTLWDASGTCTKAWNKTLQQSGNERYVMDEATIRSFSGLKIEKIFKDHFHFIPEEEQEQLLKSYKQNETDFMKELGGRLYPDVKEGLAELSKSYKLFIVSNCLAGYIENFIAFHGLQNIFLDFESSGNTGLAKSDNIQLIMDRNKLAHPVYVGDTIWDYEAARQAGIPFIFAAYGFGNVDHPDKTINEFTALLQVLPVTPVL